VTQPPNFKTPSGPDAGLSRNDRRKIRTRTRLIDAARRVMAVKGIEATTIRDITDAADVGFGSFYNYFESKEAIVSGAVRDILTQFGEIIDAFNEQLDDPVEIMAAGIGNYVHMARTEPVLSQFLVQVGYFDPSIGRNITARMVRDLQRGIDRGSFRAPDVETLRAMVTGALFSFMRERLKGELSPETDRHAVHLVLRLMGAPEADAERLGREFKRIPIATREED
jgi:AcrR family transcriptional regulator